MDKLIAEFKVTKAFRKELRDMVTLCIKVSIEDDAHPDVDHRLYSGASLKKAVPNMDEQIEKQVNHILVEIERSAREDFICNIGDIVDEFDLIEGMYEDNRMKAIAKKVLSTPAYKAAVKKAENEASEGALKRTKATAASLGYKLVKA